MLTMAKIALGSLGLFALAGLAASTTSAADDEPEVDPDDDAANDGSSNKMRLWSKLESIVELNNTQRYFLTLVAKGEGNYNPAAHNGSQSERDASSRATDNSPSIVANALACGVPTNNLRTGSWGTFQRLAPYLSGDAFTIFANGNPCPFADPTRAPQNLNYQIVSAIKVAHVLQGFNGWQAFPTVGNLRLGWAAPSLMGFISANADRLEKYRRHARAASLPDGIVDAKITEFPGNFAEIYERLRTGSVS